MSGVLTDKDIQMLQTLSSGMRVTDKGIRGSAPAIRKRLTDIASGIETALGGAQAPQQQAPAAEQSQAQGVAGYKIIEVR
jgi:hypothetical protein